MSSSDNHQSPNSTSPPPARLNPPAALNPGTLSTNNTPLHSPKYEPRHSGGAVSPSISHRSSFVDGVRGHSQRSPSVSHQALQDLINNPPLGVHDPTDEKLSGRDWRTVKVGEIISPEEVRFTEVDTSVEEATKLLVSSGAPNVVLIREHKNTRTAIGAFDYNDLNAYLLFVTNLSLPADANDEEIESVLSRARQNKPISLTDIRYLLGRKEPPAFLEHTDDLTKAVEILGGGVHRIIVRKQGTSEVVGILSQLRLVRFFWENVSSFRDVKPLHTQTLGSLNIGSHEVVSINGDKPLKEALLLMHSQGITSLPVLDNKKHVVGNISHVDIKHLTTTTSLPLLDSTCIHFITVILSERGMNDGKDSYPVFHVTPQSTLAHTVAKLVATRSHRMWIVDAVPSPGSSVPPSPGLKPSASVAPPPTMHALGVAHTPGPPYTPANPSVAVSAAVLPGGAMSGILSGVVSLTDLLNLYARASGLKPDDPEEIRRRRRTSSTSSARSNSVRASLDAPPRTSADLSRSYENVRGSTELGRPGNGGR